MDMLEDKRPILAVCVFDVEQTEYMVGRHGVTNIEVYGEPGLHCNIPFIAVHIGDDIKHRIPATQVQVTYT